MLALTLWCWAAVRHRSHVHLCSREGGMTSAPSQSLQGEPITRPSGVRERGSVLYPTEGGAPRTSGAR